MTSGDMIKIVVAVLRKKHSSPRQIMNNSLRRLTTDHAFNRHFMGMIGSCCHAMGEDREALTWYEEGAKHAPNYAAGLTLRSMAECHRCLGEYETAEALLEESFDLLPARQYYQEYLITLGFRGRLLVSMGALADALAHFAVADDQRAGPHALHNKLHYATALSCAGRRVECVRVIGEALVLIPEHGTRVDLGRALVIRYGGWRADSAVTQGRDLARRLRKWANRTERAEEPR